MATSKSNKNGKYYVIRAGNPDFSGEFLALSSSTVRGRERPKLYVYCVGGIALIPSGGYGLPEPVEKELTKTVYLEDKNTGEKSEKQVPRKTITDELNGLSPIMRYLISRQREKGRELDWELVSEEEAMQSHAEGVAAYKITSQKTGPDGVPVRMNFVDTEVTDIPYDGSLNDPFGQPLVSAESAADKGS